MQARPAAGYTTPPRPTAPHSTMHFTGPNRAARELTACPQF